jgi:pyridoxal phosphate enzyme (YggS family)
MDTVAQRLESLQDRINDACYRVGRPIESVQLMAVSKRQPEERILEAIHAGLRLFGESRVQETRAKQDLFPSDADIHLIGHLQRNKAREAAQLYQAVDSIDALRTAKALDRWAKERSTGPQTILLEVNTSGEESKQGVWGFDALQELYEAVHNLEHLHVAGLMTIGPISRDEAVLRRAFAELRSYAERLDLRELSMGMSNDFEYAILEGATTVRLGTALFGARAT